MGDTEWGIGVEGSDFALPIERQHGLTQSRQGAKNGGYWVTATPWNLPGPFTGLGPKGVGQGF